MCRDRMRKQMHPININWKIEGRAGVGDRGERERGGRETDRGEREKQREIETERQRERDRERE